MSDTKPNNGSPASTPFLVPQVDVVEDSSGITLLADLPGVKKDGLDIKVDGQTLSLEGTVALDAPQPFDAVFADFVAAGAWALAMRASCASGFGSMARTSA